MVAQPSIVLIALPEILFRFPAAQSIQLRVVPPFLIIRERYCFIRMEFMFITGIMFKCPMDSDLTGILRLLNQQLLCPNRTVPASIIFLLLMFKMDLMEYVIRKLTLRLMPD